MQPPTRLTLAANFVNCDDIDVGRCLVIEQQRCLATDRGFAAWRSRLLLLLGKRIQLRRKTGSHVAATPQGA